MKILKPYWFLESPIDLEHKYYVLMGFLTRMKKSFNKTGFERNFKEILTLRRDLFSFDKDTEFSQKTMGNMTDKEKDFFYNLLDEKLDEIDDIQKIVKNSIEVIDNFLEENKGAKEKYNSLVDVESYCTKTNMWDQGFLIVRKRGEDYMKIFNWFFSIITIGQKESVALLMTEVLDPRCETTNEILGIRRFLKKNIKDFSESFDCVIIADVSNDIDLDIGTEIGKEKSIDMILTNFKSN
jgi:hypothetical protein